MTSIDIGTNTILMLVADVGPASRIIPVHDEHRIARLGKAVDVNRRILPESFEKGLACLRDYQRISVECGSERIVARGTSFLRDAANRDEFIAFVRTSLGLEIKVLSGNEEADLTYLGAVSSILKSENRQAFAVLDIGGGSTELTTGIDRRPTNRHSLDIGAVRLTERILKTSPPAADALEKARKFAQKQIADLPPLPSNCRLIGVAGTLTTLAALDLQLPAFDRRRVDGHLLSLSSVEGIFGVLRGKTLEELHSYPQILKERADILLGGILILVEMMKKLGSAEIVVSDRGLRYGIALHEAGAVSTK